jgi:hypothetical protein
MHVDLDLKQIKQRNNSSRSMFWPSLEGRTQCMNVHGIFRVARPRMLKQSWWQEVLNRFAHLHAMHACGRSNVAQLVH